MGQLIERQRPLRREEYERMVSAGFFENEHIELVRGVILDRVVERHTTPKNGAYERVDSLRPGDSIALTAFPDLKIDVAAIFGA